MLIVFAKHPWIEPKRIRIRDAVAITVDYAERSSIGHDAQSNKIAETREGLNFGELWHSIITDDQDNWIKGYVECIREPRNQLFEFRVSGTERRDARIVTRRKGNNFAFNRFLCGEVRQYRCRAPIHCSLDPLNFASS